MLKPKWRPLKALFQVKFHEEIEPLFEIIPFFVEQQLSPLYDVKILTAILALASPVCEQCSSNIEPHRAVKTEVALQRNQLTSDVLHKKKGFVADLGGWYFQGFCVLLLHATMKKILQQVVASSTQVATDIVQLSQLSSHRVQRNC